MGAQRNMLLVALAWGITNPLIKRGGARSLAPRPSRRGAPAIACALQAAWRLASDWQYWAPLGANLAASGLFYRSLGDSRTSDCT